MMRCIAVVLASSSLAWGVPNAGATERVGVAGGEHDKYSRVVIDADSRPFRIEYDRRRASIIFPGADLEFVVDRINASQSAHRVLKARSVKVPDGARLDLELTCDCGAKFEYARSGRLVVDIAESFSRIDGLGAPRPLDVASRGAADTARTEAALPVQAVADEIQSSTIVSNDDKLNRARSKMLEMLSQAATEGIVEFRKDAEPDGQTDRNFSIDPLLVETEAPDAHIAKPTPEPVTEDSFETEPLSLRAQLRSDCRPDDWFFGGVEDDLANPIQAVERLQTELVGEFDVVDIEVLRKLYWSYIVIGFGDEARALVNTFPILSNDVPLMEDIARIIAERPVELDRNRGGLLAGDSCTGFHGLFQALALAESTPEGPIEFANHSVDAVSAIPATMTADVATRLGLAAVRAGDWSLAGHLKRVAELAGAESGSFQFLAAHIDKHRGREDKARARLQMLAEGQTERQVDALFELADAFTENGEAPPEGFAEDMGMVSAIADDPFIRQRATLLEARTLMSEGEFSSAFRQIIRTYRETPGARRGLAVAGRELLLNAMDSGTEEAKLAGLDAYIDFQEFIDSSDLGSDTEELHLVAANVALEYELPNVAKYALERGRLSGEIAENVRGQIDKLASVTSRDLSTIAEETRASWTEEMQNIALSVDSKSAEERAIAAYLMRRDELPTGTLEELESTGSDLATLFSNGNPTKVKSAADAMVVANRVGIELKLLQGAADGR
ncbi:MAG: hypothetical protein GC152_13990 [Alphaproteobacteria bacterium]|nr:hypothetical protein [Alphaproteobacteria bacterium]